MAQDYAEASRVLSAGGLIAYPTEAVWGLGCDPWSEVAVHRLLAIKQRPVSKGLIIVASDPDQIAPLLGLLNDDLAVKIQAMQSQPLTWLVPDNTHWIPDWIKGNFDSVAVRICRHPVVIGLCKAFGKPLVSTSANRAGEMPLTSRESVVACFGEDVDLVIEGVIGDASSPSAIRDLVTDQVFR